MKTRHRLSKIIVFWVVVTVVALCGLSSMEAGTDVLDGKSFLGKAGMNGKEATEEDEIGFQNGRIYSVGCAEWGFGESDYAARVEGNVIHFESVTLSPKHGKIVWKGKVQGNKIDATYVWTKKRWYWKDAHKEKWFKGTLKM